MPKKQKTKKIADAKEIQIADEKIPLNSKLHNTILFIVFGLFVIFMTTFKISGDDDIFWHLENGKYISENHTVPGTDVFGSVTAGQEWIPFEWGWDLLSFTVYNAGGYAAISILRTVLFLLFFYFLYRIIIKLDLNSSAAVVIFIILIFGIFDRLLIKPQIISYLFTSALLFILIDYAYIKRENNRKIFLLPLIFLFWVNMHMGVLAGIGIFTLFLISECIAYFSKNKFYKTNSQTQKDLIKLSVLYVASILILLVNPQGIRTFTYVYSHLNMKMMEDVYEWYSPFNNAFDGTKFRYIYYFFLGGAALTLFYSIKKKDLFAGLVILVFTFFSFRTSRFSLDFMVVSSVFLIISASYFLGKIQNRSIKEFISTNLIPKYILIALLIFSSAALINSNLYSMLKLERVTGFGIHSDDYPVKAVDFIRQNNISALGEKPFNTYGCGGFMIWQLPGTKSFIDSRGLNDEIYYAYKSVNYKSPGYEQKFEDYNFDYVLWFFPDLTNNIPEIKKSILTYLIKKNDRWKLVYWDDNSFVFLKNEDKFKDIISKNEYKYVNPYYYLLEKEPLVKATYDDNQRIIDEIQRNYSLNPDGRFINAIVKSFKVNVKK